MITIEQIDAMLEAARPSIIEGFKKEIQDSITWEVKKKASEIVGAETEKWLRAEIVPEIVKELVESKQGLIAVGAKLAPAIVEELVKGMADTFKKKMEQSWDRTKIFEAIFKN